MILFSSYTKVWRAFPVSAEVDCFKHNLILETYCVLTQCVPGDGLDKNGCVDDLYRLAE